ncbi:hypothetical protein [Arsenophonus endosymbiont of Bemisia tabaci]|uniref:hypothetical protein n=1 Tax=Arsenophonus endosymbiont of Bemisia tabaci TaxID=536059 RepID=UPI0015F5CCBD|nr:hypothetical protein [Arsenophonus endosymbiont of Bemisia tabaci]
MYNNDIHFIILQTQIVFSHIRNPDRPTIGTPDDRQNFAVNMPYNLKLDGDLPPDAAQANRENIGKNPEYRSTGSVLALKTKALASAHQTNKADDPVRKNTDMSNITRAFPDDRQIEYPLANGKRILLAG